MVGSRQVWLALGVGVLFLAVSARAAGPTEPDGSATLSQGEWAKLLVGRLGVSAALKENAPADDAASLLGARGFSVTRESKSAKSMTADGTQKTWRYDMAAVAVHETIHRTGWAGEFPPGGSDCILDATMCQVIRGGSQGMVQRSPEQHERGYIDGRYN